MKKSELRKLIKEELLRERYDDISLRGDMAEYKGDIIKVLDHFNSLKYKITTTVDSEIDIADISINDENGEIDCAITLNDNINKTKIGSVSLYAKMDNAYYIGTLQLSWTDKNGLKKNKKIKIKDSLDGLAPDDFIKFSFEEGLNIILKSIGAK